MFKFTIKLKLFLLTIFTLFVMVFLGAVSFFVSYYIVEDQVNTQLEITTKLAHALCSTSLHSSIQNYLRAIAEKNKNIVEYYYNQYEKGLLTEEQAKRIAAEILLEQKISNEGYIYVLGHNGVLQVHPFAEKVGVDISHEEFAMKQINMKRGFIEYEWQNPGEKEKRKKVTYMVDFPQWKWIISASSYQDDFDDIMLIDILEKELLQISVQKSGYIFVMDRNGIILIHPDINLKGTVLTTVKDDKSGRFIFAEILEKTEPGYIEYFWKNTSETKLRKKLAYYDFVPELEWVVVATTYYDDIYKSIFQLQIFLLLALVPTIGLIALFVIIFSSSLRRRLNKLIKASSEITKGDLTHAIEIDSSDELGTLSEYFNSLSANIRSIINSLKTTSKENTEIGTNLKQSSLETTKAAENIYQIMSSVESKIVNLNKEIHKTRSISQDIKNYINNKVLQLIQSQSAAMEQSTTSVTEMIKTFHQIAATTENSKAIFDNLLRDSKQGEAEMDRTIRSIDEIVKSANVILEMVNVINSISDKTNLLAMNAAIEAAHAGESGKGFAVVAGEIRKLAESTGHNSKSISTSIKDVIHKISGTTELTRSTSEKFHTIMEGINNAVQPLNNIINQMTALSAGTNEINKTFNNLLHISTDVNSSSSNMNEKIIELEKSIELITNASEENLSSINNITRDIHDIADAMRSLKSMGEIISKNITIVEEHLTKFRT